MATNLPTISVADELVPRILAVFESDPDNYRIWLRQAVRDKVIETEEQAMLERQQAEIRALRIQQRQESEAFAASVDTDFGGTP